MRSIVAANRLIIAGGGLAGCLAALALARFRPDIDLLLIEEGDRFGGQHIWSFFDTDLDVRGQDLVAPLVVRHWPDHQVRFPNRQRQLPFGYNSITSERLDEVVRATLSSSSLMLHEAVSTVEPNEVTLARGEKIRADAVLDARGTRDFPGLKLAWQKFAGRTHRFESPHGLEQPIVMDATVEQMDGYRFVYCLPFSDRDMLVEDTYYSSSSSLDMPKLRERIDAYVDRAGWGRSAIVAEEQGVLPIVLDGNVTSLWRGAAVPLLGLRGGFFQPTTGYSLPTAVRNAVLLASAPNLSSHALLKLFRSQAERQWREAGFYRLLNRLLFMAADPDQRYAVLEHFYHLDPALIGRFYAGSLSFPDKLRIVSGRPPVSIARAISIVLGGKGPRRE